MPGQLQVRSRGMRSNLNYGDVATTVGDALAAMAILLAAAQLRSAAQAAQQTRLDLREDRRLDFYLGQLVEIALALQKGLSVAFVGIQIRTALQMLPSDLLPMLRSMMDCGASDEGRRLERELRENKPTPAGMSFTENYQAELQFEIEEARDRLLQLRPDPRPKPKRWQLWKV